MQKKRGRAALGRSGPSGPVQAALQKKKLPKKTIKIKLQMPGKSYEMLTKYVGRYWNGMTVEKKLQDVVICWLDKAISYCLEMKDFE